MERKMWIDFLHDILSDTSLGALAILRKATITFVMSVRPSIRPSAWNNPALTGWIFMKFDM